MSAASHAAPDPRVLAAQLPGHALGLLKTLLVLAVVLTIEIGAGILHYLSVQSSLFLIGSEQKPLRADALLGQWLGDLFAEANLSSFAAFVIVAVIAFGSFWLAEEFMELLRLLEQRAGCRQSLARLPAGDLEARAVLLESVDTLNFRIGQSATTLSVVGALLLAVLAWDVYLTVYRGLAGAHGFSEGDLSAPLRATHTIQTLGLELEQHGALFAWRAVPLQAGGLLACMVLMPFAMAYFGARLAAHRDLLVLAVVGLTAAAWRSLAGEGDDGGNAVPAAPPRASTAPSVAPADAPLFASPAEEPAARPVGSMDAEPAAEVIGGIAGERVGLDQARRDPARYWVDPTTHEVWNADYRRKLIAGN